MAVIADAVFDAALNHIKTTVNKVQVRTSASAVLVTVASGITSADFGSPVNNSGAGGGRKIQCLKSSAVTSASVTSAGSASKVALLASSTVKIVASVASAPIALGASDQVNVGAFSVILKDPT